MKHRLACMLLLLLACPAAAQTVPRVKAQVLSFDGSVLVLDADAAAVQAPPAAPAPASARGASPGSRNGRRGAPPPATASDAPSGKLRVTLLPATLLVTRRPSVHEALKVGDFVGAVVPAKDAAMVATSIYIYPDALRGANEGRFADGDDIRLGGTVQALNADSITLHYRGLEAVNGVCMGRAAPPSVTPQYCSGEVRVGLNPDTPVSLLIVGSAKLLVPGAVATVSLIKTADGGMVTPGIIVEMPQSAP